MLPSFTGTTYTSSTLQGLPLLLKKVIHCHKELRTNILVYICICVYIHTSIKYELKKFARTVPEFARVVSFNQNVCQFQVVSTFILPKMDDVDWKR